MYGEEIFVLKEKYIPISIWNSIAYHLIILKGSDKYSAYQKKNLKSNCPERNVKIYFPCRRKIIYVRILFYFILFYFFGTGD